MRILQDIKLIEKGTSATCHFLGSSVVSWASKKQTQQPYQQLKKNILWQVAIGSNFMNEINLKRLQT